MKEFIIALVIMCVVSSFGVFAENRNGVPSRVLIYDRDASTAAIRVYIDPDASANCAADGIIKIGRNQYTEESVKLWTNLALIAFASGKRFHAFYSNVQIANGICQIEYASIF